MKRKIFNFITFTILLMVACNNKSNIQRMYLGGWEAKFNGDEQCVKFLETQTIDKRTSESIWSSIELVFENEMLVEAFDYEEGFKQKRMLDNTEIGLKYSYYEPNQMYSINKTSNSNSYLGGEYPSDFNMPVLDVTAPFQYLGKVSKEDEAFSWLPFDLHLAAPIYSFYDFLFLDYSDPNKPVILNKEEIKIYGDEFKDDFNLNSQIVYKKTPISTRKINGYGSSFGHCGIPSWLQHPDIPTCPKSNKTMKFLMQINSESGIKTMRTNVVCKEKWKQDYIERMVFGADGEIYIFFEPDSKVICYMIQMT